MPELQAEPWSVGVAVELESAVVAAVLLEVSLTPTSVLDAEASAVDEIGRAHV